MLESDFLQSLSGLNRVYVGMLLYLRPRVLVDVRYIHYQRI